jgi:hypothetical protein
MRSEGQVDRDAAVAVLELDDDVTPQIAVRERAGEEYERRPATGRSPSQGTEPSFSLSDAIRMKRTLVGVDTRPV